MSTERNPGDGPGMAPNEFEDVAAGGDLFIRDLAATGTPAPTLGAQPSGDAEGYDDDDDEGMVTTMMLGEEGERGGGGDKEKDERDKGDVTTQALGEEGRGEQRSAEARPVTTLAVGEEGGGEYAS